MYITMTEEHKLNNIPNSGSTSPEKKDANDGSDGSGGSGGSCSPIPEGIIKVQTENELETKLREQIQTMQDEQSKIDFLIGIARDMQIEINNNFDMYNEQLEEERNKLIDQYSANLTESMEEYRQMMEQSLEEFKTNTKEELENKYKKQLQDDIEKITNEKLTEKDAKIKLLEEKLQKTENCTQKTSKPIQVNYVNIEKLWENGIKMKRN